MFVLKSHSEVSVDITILFLTLYCVHNKPYINIKNLRKKVAFMSKDLS